MNFSLTVFFLVAVLLAMAAAILALDAMEDGAILPWQLGASYAIGLCITHGQFLDAVYAWTITRLNEDGLAGVTLSALAAILAEGVMAALPALAGAAVFYATALLDERWPLRNEPNRTRRARIIRYLRGVGPR